MFFINFYTNIRYIRSVDKDTKILNTDSTLNDKWGAEKHKYIVRTKHFLAILLK